MTREEQTEFLNEYIENIKKQAQKCLDDKTAPIEGWNGLEIRLLVEAIAHDDARIVEPRTVRRFRRVVWDQAANMDNPWPYIQRKR